MALGTRQARAEAGGVHREPQVRALHWAALFHMFAQGKRSTQKVHGSAMKYQQPTLKFLGASDTGTIDTEDLR